MLSPGSSLRCAEAPCPRQEARAHILGIGEQERDRRGRPVASSWVRAFGIDRLASLADAAADRGNWKRWIAAAAAAARAGRGRALPGAGAAAAGRAPGRRADRARATSARCRTRYLVRQALRGVDTVIHLAATIRDQPPHRIEELNGLAMCACCAMLLPFDCEWPPAAGRASRQAHRRRACRRRPPGRSPRCGGRGARPSRCASPSSRPRRRAGRDTRDRTRRRAGGARTRRARRPRRAGCPGRAGATPSRDSMGVTERRTAMPRRARRTVRLRTARPRARPRTARRGQARRRWCAPRDGAGVRRSGRGRRDGRRGILRGQEVAHDAR